MSSNERGSAMFEAIGTLTLLSTLVSGLLLVAYLWFARAWIGYQSEQSLYCLSEQRAASRCRSELREHLTRFLPFGDIKRLILVKDNETWRVDVEWNWNIYRVHAHKLLTVKAILKNRALR